MCVCVCVLILWSVDNFVKNRVLKRVFSILFLALLYIIIPLKMRLDKNRHVYGIYI